MRCRKLSVVDEGAYKGAFTEGPEYETLFAMGSMCGNSCIESLIMADRLCSDYGMDTISTGATIAFAMELYQRGIITRKDTDGLDLTWGNHEAQIELIRKIGEREGFGDILAEGSLRAGKKIGKGAERYSMTVMGQEIPGHSPRGVKTLAAAYVLSPRGATHNDLPAYWDYGAQEETYKGKGKLMAERLGESGSGSRFNYVGICRMPYGPEVEYMLEAIRLVTGWNLSLDELKLIAKRNYTLKRAFNLREGVKREHSVLPERMMTDPIPAGPLKGHVTPKELLDIIVDEFYLAMGWDPSTGIPKEETMRSLDLEWALKGLDMPDKS